MCGIIFVDGKNPEQAKTATRIQFRNQVERGQQGFGIVEIKKGIKKPKIHRALYTSPAMEALDSVRSSSILFHHRIPTSTGNTIKGTHPYRVQKNGRKMFVIHNGVLQNEDAVLEKLDIKPHTLHSYSEEGKGDNVTYRFNDSEALALDFIDAICTGRKKLYAEGSIALLAYEPALNTVWMYRNEGNPLKVFNEGGIFMAASQAPTTEGSIKSESLYKYDLIKKEMKYVRPLKSEEWGTEWKTKVSPSGSSEWQNNWHDDRNWEPSSEDGHWDRHGIRLTPIQGQEGWVAPGLANYLGSQPPTSSFDRKTLFSPKFTGGKTDLTSENKDRWMLDGAIVIRDCLLYNLLSDQDAHSDFMDELTHPDIHTSEIQDTMDFDDLIDRLRVCSAMLDELYTQNPKHRYYSCDTKAFNFLMARLRQLMWVYNETKTTFQYHCKQNQWIRDAITDARGSLLAGSATEDALKTKTGTSTHSQQQQQSSIGFRTGADTVTSNQPK